MRQMIYTLQFTGGAAPANDQGTVLKATTAAPSCSIQTTVSPNGVTGALTPTHLGGSADPKLKHGSVMWKIDRGEGQFSGATGLITSNFFVGEKGEVTDHHFGVLFVR